MQGTVFADPLAETSPLFERQPSELGGSAWNTQLPYFRTAESRSLNSADLDPLHAPLPDRSGAAGLPWSAMPQWSPAVPSSSVYAAGHYPAAMYASGTEPEEGPQLPSRHHASLVGTENERVGKDVLEL